MKKIRIWFLRQKLGILEYRLLNHYRLCDEIGKKYIDEFKGIKRQITETKTSLRKLTAV